MTESHLTPHSFDSLLIFNTLSLLLLLLFLYHFFSTISPFHSTLFFSFYLFLYFFSLHSILFFPLYSLFILFFFFLSSFHFLFTLYSSFISSLPLSTHSHLLTVGSLRDAVLHHFRQQPRCHGSCVGPRRRVVRQKRQGLQQRHAVTWATHWGGHWTHGIQLWMGESPLTTSSPKNIDLYISLKKENNTVIY